MKNMKEYCLIGKGDITGATLILALCCYCLYLLLFQRLLTRFEDISNSKESETRNLLKLLIGIE